MNKLLNISPLDGRYSEITASLTEITSEFGLNKYRLQVEIEWYKTLFSIPELKLPKLTKIELNLLKKIINEFDVEECNNVKAIEKITNHDVKAIEYYIQKKIKGSTLEQYSSFIHFACTSEDINNLSYALMIKDTIEVLTNQLKEINNKIYDFSIEYKNITMLSRTHGQIASPTTMGKEFYNVYYRLKRQLIQLKSLDILGKINGAVGNYNAHVVGYKSVNWIKVTKNFVEDTLKLKFNLYTTQIEPHDYIAEFCDIIKRINTIIIDFAKDIWGYIALNYFKQKLINNEVGSSTMPHKVNPIDFENCEGNLGLANSIANHLSNKLPISRWQRDLTDSTVLRNIGVTAGYSLLGYKMLLKGLNKIVINLSSIKSDLNDNWDILAEPIQIVMRKYGITNAYEQLKGLTRGKKNTKKQIQDFIRKIKNIPEIEIENLLTLTPDNYIGLANKFDYKK